MSLWQYLTAIVLIGGAAYTYIFQPMSLELGIPRVQCWWNNGVYLRATAKEPGYAKLMAQNPENQVRLQQGEAVGCYNEGRCVLTANEALSALEQKMLGWSAAAGGNLLVGNVLNMLGMRAEDAARAKQAEAQYCLQYLGELRREVIKNAPASAPETP